MPKIFKCDRKGLGNIEIEQLKGNLSKKANLWIALNNPSKEEIISISRILQLHPTTIEDITSQQTRTKYEEFEEYTLIIFRGIKRINPFSIETYNLSLIISKNYILSVNSKDNPIIEELLKNPKRIESLLKKGKTYIAHYFLDKEVDRYINIKFEFGEELKKIEKKFMENQKRDVLTKIFSKELILIDLRQISESLTDLCLNLTKPLENYIEDDSIPYFRDIYDHVIKMTEGFKSMLGRINGMKNLYTSISSLKTNEAMRFLTIIMAIMMPLTIVTGFYGMNISLPFQQNIHAYLLILGIMVLFSIAMILFLRKSMK